VNRRKIVVSSLAVAAVALVLAYQFGSGPASSGGTSSGGFLSRFFGGISGDNGHVIRVSGNIEVIDAEVAFKIPGKVETRPVDEGEEIKQGAVVATIECKDLKEEVAEKTAEVSAAQATWDEAQHGSREQDVKAARAAMEKAQKFYDEIMNGSRPEEIDAAKAILESAQVEKARLAEDLERAKQLYYEKHILSAQDYEAQKAAYLVASAKWQEAEKRCKLVILGPRKEQKEQAEAALEQAKWQYDLVKAGPRQEAKDQAAARLQQAKAGLAMAETRLSYATIHSPLTGVVLSKNIEPGEYVSPGTPVVTIGDLAHPWLRAYIDEPDLNRVKYKQKARITTSRYPGKYYDAWVGFIADEAEFTPKTVQTEKERTKLVYRVKIYVENPGGELKRGMPADAEILLDSPLAESSK
jgi:HlyD family secretion protein